MLPIGKGNRRQNRFTNIVRESPNLLSKLQEFHQERHQVRRSHKTLPQHVLQDVLCLAIRQKALNCCLGLTNHYPC